MSINLVLLGLAVAASPLPILAGVLMMASSQRIRDAVALGSGWFISIVFSFGLGLFLPPTVIAFAAGNEIARQHLGIPGEWIAVLLFSVIGSIAGFLVVKGLWAISR